MFQPPVSRRGKNFVSAIVPLRANAENCCLEVSHQSIPKHAATSETARLNASAFACDGEVKPESFRTNCCAEGMDLRVRGRRIETELGLDVAAHGSLLCSDHSRGQMADLNGTRSETQHAELLLADPVGRVDRLRLAEIGDRLGATAQRFIGEAAVVVGLDIGRTELDR